MCLHIDYYSYNIIVDIVNYLSTDKEVTLYLALLLGELILYDRFWFKFLSCSEHSKSFIKVHKSK